MSSIHQIQFPLSLLRILPDRHRPKGGGRDPKTFPRGARPLAQDLIIWGFFHVGRTQWERQVAWMMESEGYTNAEEAAEALSANDRYDIAAMKDREGVLPYYYQSEREAVQSAYRGFGFIWNDSAGNMRSDVPEDRYESSRKVYEHLKGLVSQKDAWVRVHRDILFDLNDKRWSWDLFAVYCAILSKLGGKRKPFPIYYEEIQARADGYLSVKHFPEGHRPLLTIDQVRTRVGKLKERGLIATHSQRHTRQRLYWLPNRISPDEAELAIAERQVKKIERTDQTAQRERIEALTQSLLNQRRR